MKLTGIRTVPASTVKVTGGRIYELFRKEMETITEQGTLDRRLADKSAGQLLTACVQAFECGTSTTDQRSQLLTMIERLVGELSGRGAEPGVSDAMALAAQISTDEGFLSGRVAAVAAAAHAAVMSCAEAETVTDITGQEPLLRRVYDIEPGDECPEDILTDDVAYKCMDAILYFERTGETIYRDYAISFWELVAAKRGAVGREQFMRLTRMLWEATGEGRFADAFEREYEELIGGSELEHCSTNVSELLTSAPGAGAVASCDGGLVLLRYGEYEFHSDGTAFKIEKEGSDWGGYRIEFTMPYDGNLAIRRTCDSLELTVDGAEYGYAVTGAGCGSDGFALIGGPFEQGSVTCVDISEVTPADEEASQAVDMELTVDPDTETAVDVYEPASAPSLISLACDGCAVYFSHTLSRYLIKLPENAEKRYTWEDRIEIPVSITSDADCFVDVDGREADRNNILLTVSDDHFTGHRLRLHSTDCSYVTSYDVVIMRESLRNAELNLEDTAHQAADAYGDVRGSFAGELCYVWDASGEAAGRGLAGTYGSSAGQQYGADPTTGYFWGSSGDRLCRRYRFELENGNYELKIRFTSHEWAGSSPTLTLDRGTDRERVLEAAVVMDGSQHTYRVRISKGMLDLSVETPDGTVDASTIEIRAQQTIAQSGDYSIVSGVDHSNGACADADTSPADRDEREDNLSFIARMQEKARYYEKLEADQEAAVAEFEKKLAAEIAEIDPSTWEEEEPDDLDLTGVQMIEAETVEDTLDEPFMEFGEMLTGEEDNQIEEPLETLMSEQTDTETKLETATGSESETELQTDMEAEVETEAETETDTKAEIGPLSEENAEQETEAGSDETRPKWAFEEQAKAEDAAAQALLSKKAQLVKDGRKTLTGVAGALAIGAGLAALLKKK